MTCLTSCDAYEEVAARLICIVDPDQLCFSGLSGTSNTKVAPDSTCECAGPNECENDTCHELPTMKKTILS